MIDSRRHRSARIETRRAYVAPAVRAGPAALSKGASLPSMALSARPAPGAPETLSAGYSHCGRSPRPGRTGSRAVPNAPGAPTPPRSRSLVRGRAAQAGEDDRFQAAMAKIPPKRLGAHSPGIWMNVRRGTRGGQGSPPGAVRRGESGSRGDGALSKVRPYDMKAGKGASSSRRRARFPG